MHKHEIIETVWLQCKSINSIAGKNDFAERSKILAAYRKVILLSYQNNYVERSSRLLEYQNSLQPHSLFLRFQ